jgi:uncharacterized protein
VGRRAVVEGEAFTDPATGGHADLHRRSLIGVAAVAGEGGQVRDVLEACERLVAGRPELELLAARHRMLGPEDN